MFTGLINLMHPVHVSVTNVEMTSAKNTVSFSIRLYMEDFEYALIHKYNKEITLPDISEEEQKFVNDYLKENFQIKLGEEVLEFAFENYKTDGELIWLFYKGEAKKVTNTVTIENKVLLDLYTDQTNLLIMSIDGKEKGYTFNISNQKVNIEN